MSVPIIGPKQCSFINEFIFVLLLLDELLHKILWVSVFAIKLTNTNPIKYKQKPLKKFQLTNQNFLNNFIYNLPIIIVFDLPNLASLKTANISVEI